MANESTASVTPKDILTWSSQLERRTCFHDQELSGGLLYSAFDSTLGFDTEYGHARGLISSETRLDNICTQFGDLSLCLERVRAETYGSEWLGINHERTRFVTRFRVSQGDQSGVYELTQSRQQVFLFDSGNLFALEDQNIWDNFSSSDNVELVEGEDLNVAGQVLVQARNSVSTELEQRSQAIERCVSHVY